MKPEVAEASAGPIGTELATNLTAKIVEAIDGFPGATAEQRAAIADLIAEGLEDYSERTRLS